jgi:hypothetical protein
MWRRSPEHRSKTRERIQSTRTSRNRSRHRATAAFQPLRAARRVEQARRIITREPGSRAQELPRRRVSVTRIPVVISPSAWRQNVKTRRRKVKAAPCRRRRRRRSDDRSDAAEEDTKGSLYDVVSAVGSDHDDFDRLSVGGLTERSLKVIGGTSAQSAAITKNPCAPKLA